MRRKHTIRQRIASLALCACMVLGMVPPAPAEAATYSVNLKTGITLVPTDLTEDKSFMNTYVLSTEKSANLNLNKRFERSGYENVNKTSATLSSATYQKKSNDFWWIKYEWKPTETERQYLADSNYPLIYVGNVTPYKCDHLGSDNDHWCKACVRLTANGWNFGDVDRWGGNFIWYHASDNKDSGTSQEYTVQKDSITFGNNNDPTLTYAAYSEKRYNCGNPKVGGSVFYMVDTTVPYITDVSISGDTYQSLAGGDVSGTVTLTFSENIRFADNKVPDDLKLKLDAFYGSQSGQKAGLGYDKLYADFTSLSGNQMTFTFTVDDALKDIYITGISRDQAFLHQSTPLYLYDGNGNRLDTELTSPAMITDISGNYVRTEISSFECSYHYYDSVAPTLTGISLSGRDVSSNGKITNSFGGNSGNSKNSFAGVGDQLTFKATFSENIKNADGLKATLLVKKDGKAIELGVKRVDGNCVEFETLTVDEGMQTPGTQFKIASISGLDNVTDYCGNKLSQGASVEEAQKIYLDVDKPTISTTLDPQADGVYIPMSDEDGEYFTIPLQFTDVKEGVAMYSGLDELPVEFTLEMIDGGTYSYQWYMDNQQSVNKNATWNNATTGKKCSRDDIADSSGNDTIFYLHIKLDKLTDYNYTKEGGMDDSGVYFNAKLTVNVSDWAGNQAEPLVMNLKQQVDTSKANCAITSNLVMKPNYTDTTVTFTASFQVTDDYSIGKILYRWHYKWGETDSYSNWVEIDNLGSGLNVEYNGTVSDTYDYDADGNERSGSVSLEVKAEDRVGNRADPDVEDPAIISNEVSFNFTKPSSKSSVTVNRIDEAVTKPVVSMAEPEYVEGGNYQNTPRSILVIPNANQSGYYWIWDPWDYESKTREYIADPIKAVFEYMDAYDAAYGYYDVSVREAIPGSFYYVTGNLDPKTNSGTFNVDDVLNMKGAVSDLRDYIKNFYGCMDLYIVTTSELKEFDSALNSGAWSFTANTSAVDSYRVYLINGIQYDVSVRSITDVQGQDAKEKLDFQGVGTPAKTLDNVSVQIQISNAKDANANCEYGLQYIDFLGSQEEVKLYYRGSTYYSNQELVQTWDLNKYGDGIYILTIDSGKCIKNGWYSMELTVKDTHNNNTTTYELGRFFMDSTELDINLDSYYKAYSTEGLNASGVTRNDKDIQASYDDDNKIVLALDTAPEGWTLDTYLSFSNTLRSSDDALYYIRSDSDLAEALTTAKIRVYNSTYNAARELVDATSGIWVTSSANSDYDNDHKYVPYLADLTVENPYGSADDLKLPFLEGDNLLVYEVVAPNGTVTANEIIVNVYGETEQWILQTEIETRNGIDINSVTISASAVDDSLTIGACKFGYLNGNYNYNNQSYTLKNDVNNTFYLIDPHGNLSVKDFALLDENGNLVDIDGNAPNVFVDVTEYGEYGSSTFHLSISANDTDSPMDPKNVWLTFDAAYSALLWGLPEPEDGVEPNTQTITMPLPLALDENGELLKNEDGTYAVWESYDVSHYGIFRTQVIQTEPAEDDAGRSAGKLEIEVWGAWHPESSGTEVTLTATVQDAYQNTGSKSDSFSPYFPVQAGNFSPDEDSDCYCKYYGDAKKEHHINIDKKATDEGALGVAFSFPIAAADGYGIQAPATEAYSLGQHSQYFSTTAPMIVQDGDYTIRVTDLFGIEHELELTTYAFGELGIDVTYSTIESTNEPVTVTAVATGNYDKIVSITSSNGDVGTIDPADPANAYITVSDNCLITIVTEAGQSRTVKITNIDKELGEAYITYYNESYNILDPDKGAQSVVAVLSCDEEMIYATNGELTYEFPAGSKKGATYTFEYMDAAGNTGSITATLPCDLADPPEVDEEAPEILVSLYAATGGRFEGLGSVTNPDDGDDLNEYLGKDRAQKFRLVFTVSDASDTKVVVQPTGEAAPESYDAAVQGCTAENATLSVSGVKATIDVSENTSFDVYIIDEAGNICSVTGIKITTIDNNAPVLTPKYETSKDENGFTIVTATFYPTEEEKYEVITAISAGVTSKPVQIDEEVIDEETGETVPIMANRFYHVFTTNGEYSFTYRDELGNIGTATAKVQGLSTDAATVTEVNWYGTKSTYGLVNVTPDKSGNVNHDVIAKMRMNKGISEVTLYKYDAAEENGAGEALFETDVPVHVSFTATSIEVIYTENVDYQILVQFTASASGRKGYYVLPAVTCIDRVGPVVTVKDAQLSADKRSMVITFETDEEALMSKTLTPAYTQQHSWIAKDNKPVEITFTDEAGNQTIYTVTENASVDTLDLTALFSLSTDGSASTASPAMDLKLNPEDTVYLKVNKTAQASMDGSSFMDVAADTWTAIQLPDDAGTQILDLIDANTGELLQVLVSLQLKDHVYPVINLDSSTLLINEGVTVEEMMEAIHSGVTVTDNLDEDIGYTVTGYPDAAVAGLYILKYSAQDSSGNVSTIGRTLYIMAEGTPILKVNGEAAVPYGKVFLDSGDEGTEITLEMINMDEMMDQPLVIKVQKGKKTTGQMKYDSTMVEDMTFTVSGTGHYTVYIRSQDRIEYVTYIYIM